MCLGKCLTCIGFYKQTAARQAAGEEVTIPEIKDAVSMVPTWQQTSVGMQQMFACVTIPSCLEHIEVKEMSAMEKIVQGGRILQGSTS